MEQNEEKKDDIEEQSIDDEFEEGSGMQWLKDNLRIIISVLIVVIIAVGIYSYSNRSEAPATEKETATSDILSQISGTEDEKNKDENVAPQQEGNKAEEKTPAQKMETKEIDTQDKTSSVSTSQETESSFTETAGRGDSHTKLARRALANYLEKSPDSSLTPEHKIYIEDYLRKHSGNKGKVNIGTSVEFSKTLIQEAITKSKNLNENQLKNLHKYAVRVPSLS